MAKPEDVGKHVEPAKPETPAGSPAQKRQPRLAAAAVMVPTLAPGEPVQLTAVLDRELPGEFDVSALPNAPLMAASAKVTVVEHTASTVTLQVVVEHGWAGAGAIFVICN